MFLLTDDAIERYRSKEEILIKDFQKRQLGIACYYFSLGKYIEIWNEAKNCFQAVTIGTPGKEVVELPSRGYAKVRTLETFKFSERVLGIIDQYSGLTDEGLMLNNSPTIDPRFIGPLELGIANLLPRSFPLRFGMLIGKLIFFDVSDTYPIQNPEEGFRGEVFARRRKLADL